jgi:hypothetical protein
VFQEHKPAACHANALVPRARAGTKTLVFQEHKAYWKSSSSASVGA